jgi:TonB family protein
MRQIQLKYLLALTLLWPTSVLAQTAPTAPMVTVSSPKATGVPHACPLSAYPQSALEGHIEGTTTLAFHIAIDGSVKGISVFRTSGNSDLDQAAIGCASSWRYLPALQNGQPLEVSWKASVVFRVDDILSPRVAGQPHACAEQNYPPWIWAVVAEASTTVSFRIATNGTVNGVTVVKSSGLKEIDDAAVRCASDWRYAPATQAGQPVEVPWKAAIKLQNDADNLPPVAIGAPHVCADRPSGSGSPTKPTVISFKVDAYGNVADVFVERSSGDDVLDKYASACVAKWQYKPGIRDGRPAGKDWGAKFDW